VCVVDISGGLCVLMDKMRLFEFWSFYKDDAMRACVVGVVLHERFILSGTL
jgi:hypothetical protein